MKTRNFRFDFSNRNLYLSPEKTSHSRAIHASCSHCYVMPSMHNKVMFIAVLVVLMLISGWSMTTWGANYVPLGVKTITSNETVYCTDITSAGDPATSWVVVPSYGTSSVKYTNLSTTDKGNPLGLTDNLPTTASNVNMIQIKADGNTYTSSKRVIHMHVKGITAVIAHGNTSSSSRGLSIAAQEYTVGLSTFPTSGIVSFTRPSNSGCLIYKKDGLDASKEYIISIYAASSDTRFYAVEFIAGATTKNVYVKPNGIWNVDGARYAAYYWKSANTSDNGWVSMTEYDACSPSYKATIPAGYDKVILCRMNGAAAANNWDNKWNQTADQNVPTGNDTCWTVSDWSAGSWGTYTRPTRSITFANGGGTGTMTTLSVSCGDDKTITANSFTRDGYLFSGWKADVTVTIGGVSKSAGTIIADGATLQNITDNITLTAQWAADTPGADLTVHAKSDCDYLSAYNKSYVVVDSREYEVYGFSSTGSSANHIWAGTTTTTSTDPNHILSFATTERAKNGWISNKVNGRGSSYSNLSASGTEFNGMGTSGAYRMNYRSNSELIIKVSGYDQFSMYGKDNSTTNKFQVFVDETNVTTGTSSTAGVRRYTLTTGEHTIRITALNSSNCEMWGFSLRIPSRSAATAYTLSANTLNPCLTASQSTTLTLSGSQSGVQYQLLKGGVAEGAVKNGTGSALTWTGITTAGTYTVKALANCTYRENTMTGSHAVVPVSAPTSVAVGTTWAYKAGQTITLTATPTPATPTAGSYAYQWKKGGVNMVDGDNISGATTKTLKITTCTVADGGNYTCEVSNTSGCSKTSDNFGVRVITLFYRDNSSGDETTATTCTFDGTAKTATFAVYLSNGDHDYGFKINDGLDWWGKSQTISATTADVTFTNAGGTPNCTLHTDLAGTYTFVWNFETHQMTVNFPVFSQAAGKTIFFDDDVLKWGDDATLKTPQYRIGKPSHSTAKTMTKVRGTAYLWKVVTDAYNDGTGSSEATKFESWQIANNTSCTGSGNSIYTVNGCSKAATKGTDHQKYAVTAAEITLTPGTVGYPGSPVDGCTYYPSTWASGMKKWKATITAPTNGTITVDYTDTAGVAQSFTSGNATMAHTCNLTITATPNTGYHLGTLTTKTGDADPVAHTSGNAHILRGTTTIAATFVANNYTITLNNQSATTAGTASVTATFNANTNLTTAITCPTKTGKVFRGYFTETGGGGTQLINEDGTWIASVASYTGASRQWLYANNLTLYAYWDTPCYIFTPATSGSAPSTGSTISGTGSGGTMTMLGGTFGYTSNGLEFQSSSSSKVNVKLDNNMQAGSVITVQIYIGDASTRGLYLYNSAGTRKATFSQSAIGTYTFRYTVVADDGLEGESEFQLWRYNNATLKYITVHNCGAAKIDANVYAFSNGAFADWGTCNGGTLTLANSQSGVSYQLYKGGVAEGDPKAGTGSALNWTVTSSGVYTVKSVENATYKETAMTGTATVTLQNPALEGPSTVTVEGTITLTHLGYLIAGDNWVSSNTSVATVSPSGVVTGVSVGSATITFHGVGACDGTKVITVGLPASESCITLTNFETSNHGKSGDNKPDSQIKYIYGYKSTTMTAANAVTITTNNTNNKGQNSGVEMRADNGSTTRIYASNATTETPASFENVVSVSFDAKLYNSGSTTRTQGYTIKVGGTTVGSGDITGVAADGYKHITTGDFSAKNGYIDIVLTSTGSSNTNLYIDNIEICTSASGFVLNYNANGGTGTTTSQAGTSLTVKSCGFSRTGYAFDHWNTAADDSGTDYAPGDPITLTGTTTLYAQWVEEMASECSWAYWFTYAADATSNGKTNNSTVFSGCITDGSSGTGSSTVEGTKFDFTRHSGSKSGNVGRLVVPAGHKATFYAVVNPGGSSKSMKLVPSVGEEILISPLTNSDGAVIVFENLPAGTYTINYPVSLSRTYMYAAYICADCADKRPEITGSLTGCPTVTLTATNYTDGALLQWYKKVGSDFVALDGETGTTYTATETGLYKLAAQKTCRLETEPVSVTISLAVNSTAIPTATKTYEQGAAATPLTASVLAEGDAATTASEYLWQYQEWDGSAWGALTTIDDATTSSYTPSTATVCRKRYRVGARNNCNEGTWKYSSYVTIDVIASSTVTGSWKVDGANVESSAKGYVKVVNAGGWYDVKATFTTTTATPTITMMTDGVKIDNRVVEGTTITARVYVPASAADTVRVKAAVEAVTTGTAYSSCEIILKLAVTQCASNTKLPVKASSTDAGSSYTGWRYYWETAGVGKITAKSGVSTISQESASYEGFSYRNGSNGSEYRFQTYIGGVSKVRVYVYNDASSVRTVSNVYYHTALFTDKPSGYEISPTIIYQYPDEGGIKGKSNSYFDIVLSTPMIPNSCMAIILNNNVKVYGVELTGSSGSGTVPTLQWNQSGSATLEDIHTSPGSSLMQKASIKTPDNFKSIAGIQYRSTNSDVATVDNATGEVTIVSPSTILVAETCSIAAKLPVSGCYAGSAEIYYRVIVDPCPDKAPVIATDRNDYCVGHEPVISITSYDGEITGWFKNGVKIPDTEGLTSITASGIGNYYVTTHKTCDVDVRSNSIVIVAAEAPSVTVLHSGWHIRRGREIGVPLQLFKVEGTNLTTTIAWTLNGAAHTLSGVSCSLVDGIYQMTGTPSGSGAATLTGTITVTNECGQSTTKSTTIIVDPAAANTQVAYVVKGTKGGGWTATQADNLTGLYTYLAAQPEFDVTACNGYNTTVLEDLLAYYSQYDVVVLTDYLNSAEKPGSGNPGYNKANNISYSDAFGCLVDVKPMLTTEAYVSGKSQWTKVGLTSNPSDGTNTDNQSLKMTLLCPAAEIFVGTDYHVGDIIQVADALPGGSENKMLQGFAPTAARDFVYMATVMGGDGKELITLCERQHELRARLMVFGLNWHGSEVMNNNGNLTVKQILLYLMKWNADQVSDCAIYFDNGAAGNGNGKWNTASNWGPAYNHVPRYYENVRIEQPCEVNTDNAMAASIRIAVTTGTVTGANGKKLNGSLTIADNGALTVNGGIYKVVSEGSTKDFVTKQQLTPELLSINSSASGQGALAFGEINNNMLPRARVGLYSPVNFTLPTTLAEYESFIMPWQYIGTPYSDGVAQYQYYNAWMCRWDESAASDDKAWIYIDDYDKLVPFQGYALSQQSATYYCQPGLLNKPENKNFTLRKSSSVAEVGGYNFLANSFTAPIELAKLESTDFENAEATIYMFNSGDYNQWTANKTTPVSSTTAGQYIALPVNAASYTGTLSAIPPMQGFYVKATSDGGSFAIDYEKAVLDINATMAGDAKSTSPLRAPRRTRTIDDDDPIRVTTILLQGESAGDMVSILTGSEEFTDGFDNGWDGTKMLSDDRLPILSVMGKDEDYSVSSQPQLEGTVLNFRAGNDEEYVLTIATPISGLVLKDLVSNAEIPLIDTTEYVFNSANRTIHPRFVISRKHNVVTDTEQNLSGSFNAYVQDGKIVIDNKSGYAATAFIYDTTGKLIQSSRINANSNVQVEPVAAQGVYMVRIITTEATNTIKVTF